jgi:starch phosphorylase
LCPDCVRVQLYREPTDGEAADPIIMHQEGPINGGVNGFNYTAIAPADRPAEYYTPRIVPFHPDAFIPLEDSHVHWRS